MSKNITVYTSIFGAKNFILHEPEKIYANANYLCFTDNPNVTSNIYKIIKTEPLLKNDPERSSKYIRLFPEKYFDTEFNIWIDSTMIPQFDPEELINNYLTDGNALALYTNHLRDSLVEEASYLETSKKIDIKPILEQINNYKKDGYLDSGLYFSGFMIRRTFDTELQHFNSLWWQELLKHSSRLEISLPYLLWKTKLPVGVIKEGNVHENPYYNFKSVKN